MCDAYDGVGYKAITSEGNSGQLISAAWLNVYGYMAFKSGATRSVRVLSATGVTTANFYSDDFTYNQVLTPSATGCWVYRDPGHSNNGWYKDAAFNMNDTTYTFNIYQSTSLFGGATLIDGASIGISQ